MNRPTMAVLVAATMMMTVLAVSGNASAATIDDRNPIIYTFYKKCNIETQGNASVEIILGDPDPVSVSTEGPFGVSVSCNP